MTKEEAMKLKGGDLVRIDRLEGLGEGEKYLGMIGGTFKTGVIPADTDYVYLMKEGHCFAFPLNCVSLAGKDMVAPQEELNCNYCKNFSFLGGICTKRCAGFSKECFER